MANQDYFTISELAVQAQVTPRTIRYYTAEGVLPPPDTRGRYALYGQDHLQRLRLIARLKLSHLPLNEIRSRLNQLEAHEVELLLQDEQPTSQPESAIEYLTHILDRPAVSERFVREQPAQPPALYASQLPADANRTSAASHGPADQKRRVPVAEQRLAARPASFFKRSNIAADTSTETWQRITLVPGVELHIQSTVMQHMDSEVKQLQQRAQELFGEPEQL